MIALEKDHFGATNPFRPGMGLDPPYLADRAAQLERFDTYLAAFPSFPRNVRLIGLRGVGKTVLLQHYAAAAEARGWVVVRRECSEHLKNESTFALALVDDCRTAVEHSSRTLAIRQRSSTAARRALDLLGGLTVTLEGVTLAVKPPTLATHQPAVLEDRLFHALKLACEGAEAAHRPGVLFCYDEAHVLADSPRRRQFPLGIFLASVARAQRSGLAVMLVMSGLPTLTDNLARARSYSERMFQAEVLDALRPPEDVLAFVRPLESSGRAVDAVVVESVRRDTGGYPFHIQFFGALLWEACSSSACITDADFVRHRPTILRALDRAFFDARLARTSSLERRALRAVAAGGESTALHALRQTLNLPNRRMQPLVSRLEAKGLLYRPERGRLAFTVPLFGDYLRRSGASG
jgi:AAA ATPase domain